MTVVSIYEAKANLSKLIASLESGEERVVLCRHGVPVADLVPHRKESPLMEPDSTLAGARFVESAVTRNAPAAAKESPTEEEWPAHLL